MSDEDRLRDELEIQALLDGELTPAEAARLRARIASSPHLQAIETELRELIGDCTHLFAGIDGTGASGARAIADAPAAPLRLIPDAPQRAATTHAPAATRRRVHWIRSPMLRAAAIALVVGGVAMVAGRRIGVRLAGGGEASATPGARPNGHPATVPRPAGGAPDIASGPPRATRPAEPGGERDAVPIEEPRAGPPGASVAVIAEGMRRLATRAEIGGAPSGTITYAIGSETLTLDYGSRAAAKGGITFESIPAPAASPESDAPPPERTNALERRARGGAAGAGSRDCAEGIRWRDASGMELRLSGRFTCAQLRAYAARIRVAAPH